MRLSDWRATERGERVMSDKVAAAFTPALAALGAEPDPIAHVVWGDDPDVRYAILAVADAGLLVVHVRVNVPQEGPRASGKLVRWSRVQVGELAVEAYRGHRHLTTQVEGIVMQATDEEADQIGGFVAHLMARIDGRIPVSTPSGSAGRGVGAKQNARSVSSTAPIALPAATDDAR